MCPTRIDPALDLQRGLRLFSASAGVAVHSILVHHRAVSARVGVLGRRGFAVEAARVCGEGGGRVTDVMDVAASRGDARRLEIVADGLPMFGRVRAIDTTLVFALRHRRGSSPICKEEGTGFSQSGGPRGRGRLVVLAAEVAGRWSEETRDFLNQLARGKAPRISGLEEAGSTSLVHEVVGHFVLPLFTPL